MHKITPEDLVQYLYHETPLKKTNEIKAALDSDWSLREAYEQLVSAKKLLKPDISPREEVIKKILDHADKTISHLHSL